ncbi:putative membrane protein [Pontibacter ummariensis]|uniref:Putative membrane protein n=2 Tax=Pontibacter ummariensis TaxID=1610492 RepID=A0A239GAC6_9BACT|nr:DUF4142 domain-containing protein [Pontibacter ummariensis]PRY11607.1 putative membrane protein [Pontibacter ummariensis]SNS64984.1 putative membrane protein [Pontibacter ummariensis]
MKNLTTALICLLGMLTFASCNSGTEEQQEDIDAIDTATVAGLDETLPAEKQELLVFAARNNMLQIELGEIAVERGVTENVRVFGQQLIDWYTSKQVELQELAAQYDVALPQELEQAQLQHIEEIRGIEESEFDDEYWDSVIAAQKDAIDEYEDSLNDVDEANASAFSLWARNTLKELHAQLIQAEAFELELENRGEAGISNSI